MFNSTITVDTDKVYERILQRQSSAVYKDASTALTESKTITIAHDTQKDGRISSVVIFGDDNQIGCSAETNYVPLTDSKKAQLKLMYNPANGSATLDAEIDELFVRILSFFSDVSNKAKIKNQEF